MPQQFHWTEQKRQAFALLDQGHSIRAIADQLGISRRTLEGWARRPAWQELREERNREFNKLLNEERMKWFAEFSAKTQTLSTRHW